MVDIIKTSFIILSILTVVLASLLVFNEVFLLALINCIIVLSIIIMLMHYQKSKTIVKKVIVPYEVEKKVPIVRKVIQIKKVPIIKKIFVNKAAKRTKFYGHSMSKTYHKPICMFGKRIALTNLMKFFSENQARRRKYHRCNACF